MKTLSYFLLVLFLGSFLPRELFPEVKAKQLGQKLNRFLEADTSQARELLADFSSRELELLWNDYRRDKPLQEKRIFWLLEEYHSRKADEIATSRLIYLSLAVTLLFLLIIAFLYSTVSQQKKLLEGVQESKMRFDFPQRNAK